MRIVSNDKLMTCECGAIRVCRMVRGAIFGVLVTYSWPQPYCLKCNTRLTIRDGAPVAESMVRAAALEWLAHQAFEERLRVGHDPGQPMREAIMQAALAAAGDDDDD